VTQNLSFGILIVLIIKGRDSSKKICTL